MVNERALMVREPQTLALTSLGDMERFGKIMADSGMFSDIKSAAQAVVKIAYGQELGVPPITALTKIHFFSGKPTMSAEIMGSLIKRSGVWDYEVVEMTDQRVSIQFLKNCQSFGQPSTFSMEDAKKAGVTNKDNWSKYPRNMMFARALSNGARWYCPHVIGGAYVPEELDAPIDEDGNIVIARSNGRRSEVQTVQLTVSESPDELNPPEDDEAPDLETPPTGTGALGQIYDLIAMAPDAHAVQIKRRFLANNKAERLEDVPEDKLAAAIPWFKAELAK